ncbi:MAG TPA: hypothetical protein PLW49_00205, partial [bacterium]|nr:hypothetical protein [bacterium]
MNKKLKITIGIFTFALLLYIGLNLVNKNKTNSDFKKLSPLSEKSSIFSFFSEEKVQPKKIVYGYLPYWNLNKIDYLQLDK